MIDRALADLGTPCTHKSLERTHTHRWWGLLICGYPCFNGTWGIGEDDDYTWTVSARIQSLGRKDPAFAAQLHRRVIDQDDKRYFWQAFMDDHLAPERIVAPNTREALSWLKGSSETDYRSLWWNKSTAESIAWVEEAYVAGATKVFAAEIQPYEWNRTRDVNHVLIRLPTEAKLRAPFFQWIGKQYRQTDDRPQDYGQSFVDYGG